MCCLSPNSTFPTIGLPILLLEIYINRSQTQLGLKLHALFLFWEYINRIFVAVHGNPVHPYSPSGDPCSQRLFYNIHGNALIIHIFAPLEAGHEVDATAKTLSLVNPAVCQLLAELSGQSSGKINRTFYLFRQLYFFCKCSLILIKLYPKCKRACPASQVKKNQAHLLNREPLSWFCVSDLLILI